MNWSLSGSYTGAVAPLPLPLGVVPQCAHWGGEGPLSQKSKIFDSSPIGRAKTASSQQNAKLKFEKRDHMKLQTTLLGKTYGFRDLKEVLAKANEEKTGDKLAGLAAETAQERVAAKVVLSAVLLADLR